LFKNTTKLGGVFKQKKAEFPFFKPLEYYRFNQKYSKGLKKRTFYLKIKSKPQKSKLLKGFF